ncbi:MAG TPA: protein kinase [Gemmatimonadaceae bacterium]|nr:protein kinase [Gemmatimonadaceae bacterium]
MTDDLTRLRAALADRYMVRAAIGAGGMATVYLASDLKHDRNVALKVMHPVFAEAIGADRFLAEIRVTAALQHPNILPLYDSGQVGDLLYYVMPLVEGESLRDKLSRERQLPVEQAIAIARTVAAALDYAHGRGIVHRDIKPENILLQHGQALVADFGIALAVKAAGGSRLTEAGVAVGTPNYMSPEQALGESALDQRADVYALGATLYEMLAGRPPFSAATQQAVIGKIISEPAPSVVLDRPTVPPHVDAAVRQALEKIPADRFPSAQAFADALVNPSFQSTRTFAAIPVRSSWRERFAIPALATAGVALLAAAWFATRPAGPPAGPVLRYRLSLPPQGSLTTRYASRIALSPDGSRLAYMGPSAQGVQLWVRRRDQLEGTPIPGTTGAAAPFFSPDGSQVGFLNVGRQSLHAVSLDDGAITTLVDSAVVRVGAAWGEDGLLYVDAHRGLVRLPVNQPPDSAEVLVGLDRVPDPKFPQFVPNGKGVLFTRSVGGHGNEFEIAALPAGSREAHTVVRGRVAVAAGPDAIVFVTATGQLQSVRIDPDRLRVIGEPVTIAEDIEIMVDAMDVTMSSRGTLIFGTRSTIEDRAELTWTARDGSSRVIDPAWFGDFQSLALSPDGSRLAVTLITGTQKMDIWTKAIAGGPPARLTLGSNRSFRPAWTADGRSVGYVVEQHDQRHLFARPADGSASERRVIDTPVNQALWSKDGRWLVYRTGRVDDLDIYARRTAGDTSAVAIAAAVGVNEHSPSLSPDGKWLAFVSDKSGAWEVYVRPFPDASAGEWQVSEGGASEPLWGPNSRELFYKHGNELVAAEILTAPGFSVGRRRVLFTIDEYYNFSFHPTYDVAPDGQHFVMIRSRHFGETFDLVVIENWSAPPGSR